MNGDHVNKETTLECREKMHSNESKMNAETATAKEIKVDRIHFTYN